MNKAKYTIEYVENISGGFGGKCYYPLLPKFFTCKIEILTKYPNDTGLINHEIKHAEQYSNNFFHAFLYYFIDSYRYKCELEAFTEQLKAYNVCSLSQCMWITDALLSKYNLDKRIYTKEKIETDLLKIIETQK